MTPAELRVLAACVEASVSRGIISDEHGSELIQSLKALALAIFDVRTLDEWRREHPDRSLVELWGPICYIELHWDGGQQGFGEATPDEARAKAAAWVLEQKV